MAEYGINGTAGKWGRAISIVGEMPTARETMKIEEVEITSTTVNVHNVMQNDNIVDLSSVGHEEVTREMSDKGVEMPFQQIGRAHV